MQKQDNCMSLASKNVQKYSVKKKDNNKNEQYEPLEYSRTLRNG